MEKPFNYSSLEVTRLTHVHDAMVVKPHQCVISNNKRHTFSSLMVNCSLQDSFKGTVNISLNTVVLNSKDR